MKSRNSVKSGETEAPYGYVFPRASADMTRVAFIVNMLRLQGIEVGRATAEVKLQDGHLSRRVADHQAQPALRPPGEDPAREAELPRPTRLTTYDDTGWTMGLMSHADVKEIADKAMLDVRCSPSTKLEIAGAVKGDGPVTRRPAQRLEQPGHAALSPEGREVRSDREGRQGGRHRAPAGIVPRRNSPRVRAEIAKLGLQAVALAKAPDVAKHSVDLPRARHVQHLGQHPGCRLGPLRVRPVRARLRPHLQGAHQEGQSARRLRRDRHPEPGPRQRQGPGLRHRPAARQARRLQEDPRNSRASACTASPRTSRGGMGCRGVAELDKFVNQGGVLITLGASSFLPAEMGITRDRGSRAHRRRSSTRPGRSSRPDPAARAPDFLRLHADHRAGALGRRSAAARRRTEDRKPS